MAVDGTHVAFKNVGLPLVDNSPILSHKDLRLGKQAFDSSKHFTEQKKITTLQKGDHFGIGDLATASFEICDTLTKVFNLLKTLNQDNSTLSKFGFLLQWEKLSLEEKLDNYGKFASHELNFFVFKKDRAFFDQVVAPFLKNKKEKTFFDHYLLGNDLSTFLEPIKFAKLNTAEKILLGERTGKASNVSQYIAGMYAEMPKNNALFGHIFNTALAGRALDTESAGEIKLQLRAASNETDYNAPRQFFTTLGATKQ